MLATPKNRAVTTLDSIANVTTAPGSRRTSQSKVSKGANGRPAIRQPANDTATSAAVSRSPASAPLSGVGTLRGRRSLFDVDVIGSPASANAASGGEKYFQVPTAFRRWRHQGCA